MPSDWEDVHDIAQITQIIRSEPSVATSQALLDLMSLGRVLSDLGDDRVWQNPRLALDTLRILDILHQSTLYSRDAQSTILAEDQIRHRYYNLYGENPHIEPARLIFLLRSANWVQVQRGEPIRLTPLGRRMAGILLRSTNEALVYYRKSRLDQGLHDLRRQQAYAQAFDEQGIDGADTLGEKVAGLVQMAEDLKSDLAMSIFRGEVLTHLDVIKREMAAVLEEVDAALAREAASRHTPAQLRSLSAEASDAYAVAHTISYEALGEVFKATQDLGGAPVGRISEESLLEFLREAALQANEARNPLLALIDDGAAPEVTLLMPVKLQLSADPGLLGRGLEALLLAEPPAPSSPPPAIVFADPTEATAADLAAVRGEQDLHDFAAVAAQITAYLAAHGDTSLQRLVGVLCADALDAPVHLLGTAHVVKEPGASLRVVTDRAAASPVTYDEYLLGGEGLVIPAGPRTLRIVPSRALREEATP